MENDRPSSGPVAGDEAFERLYKAHHRAVLGYCARRASRWDAWDAAAEVFLVAWRRIDEVPPSGEALPWLLGVAYRVLANQRRSTGRRSRLTERIAGAPREAVPRPDELLIRNEEATEVVEALSRLSPPDREVLQLALWEELAPVEIAAVLGISREAVDQRYSRARRRLARHLDRQPLFGKRATRVTTEKGGVA